MRRILGCIALGLALLIAAPARADTWALGSGLSYHTDRTKHYNERNFGLGLSTDVATDTRLTAMFYRNSFYRESVFIGAEYTPLHLGSHVRVGFEGGLISGYVQFVEPIVVPLIKIEGDRFGVNIIVVPPIPYHTGVFGAQLETKF